MSKPITFTLDGDERAAADKFVDKHRRKHGPDKTAIGGRFSFTFTHTGLGTVVEVRCSDCRKKRNVTDYGAW